MYWFDCLRAGCRRCRVEFKVYMLPRTSLEISCATDLKRQFTRLIVIRHLRESTFLRIRFENKRAVTP